MLHVSPEAALGSTLAIVQNGDEITLDVFNKTLHLHVTDEQIAARKALLVSFRMASERGYVSLYQNTVEQAHLGADLNFLKGGSGSIVTKDSH